MPLHRGAVHLMGQNHAGKAGTDRRADGAPARHDLADVLFAPQAEREPVPAGGDAGDDTEAGGPFLKLHPGNRRVGDRRLTEGGGSGRGCSKISRSPPHCARTTIAIVMRSAGKAGHGPSSNFGTCPPRSGRIRRSWPASTISWVPSRRGRTPSRSNPNRMLRRSSLRTPSIVIAPLVTAASPMNEPISMWSGPTVQAAALRGDPPSMVRVFVPTPWTFAPRSDRKRARS